MQQKSNHTSRSKKSVMSKSKIRSTLIAFFNVKGMSFCQNLAKNNLKKETRVVGGWLDSAPVHNVLLVWRFLDQKQNKFLHMIMPLTRQISLCDFFLFPKLEFSLKGTTYFQSVEDIQKETTLLLKGLSQNDFQRYFQEWQESMQHCANAQGNYSCINLHFF
jgi:hypothetical protein